ncbi:MAG: hypothetical protein RL514_3466 [Verrucomicrobiota bacterium]|jgi:hypothetical protein
MKTTTIEMNRVLRDFTAKWPNHQGLLAGLPTSPDEDLELYRAAGPWPGSTPLSEEVAPNLARAIATEVLRDARLELAVAMAARTTFNDGKRDAAQVRSLCCLPLVLLIQRFKVTEACLADTDMATRAWVEEQADQLHYLESAYENLLHPVIAGKRATLCELRQLAGAYSAMTGALLEFYWGTENDPFEQFFAKVVTALPHCDFRQRGRDHCWVRLADQQEDGNAGDQSLAA